MLPIRGCIVKDWEIHKPHNRRGLFYKGDLRFDESPAIATQSLTRGREQKEKFLSNSTEYST